MVVNALSVIKHTVDVQETQKWHYTCRRFPSFLVSGSFDFKRLPGQLRTQKKKLKEQKRGVSTGDTNTRKKKKREKGVEEK
jgi:hypothetical protein